MVCLPGTGLLTSWISLIIWATELDTSLSSLICQPASMNKIDLRKPSSVGVYRNRYINQASFVVHLFILFFKRRWVGGWMGGDGFN